MNDNKWLCVADWGWKYFFPVVTETDHSFGEIYSHIRCVSYTHIISRSNLQPLNIATEYFDSGIFVCARLESFFYRNILPNIYLNAPIYEKNILPTHDCRVVTRVETGEDCVLRIADEIRKYKETLHVAISTRMCKKNPDFQFLSENTLYIVKKRIAYKTPEVLEFNHIPIQAFFRAKGMLFSFLSKVVSYYIVFRR